MAVTIVATFVFENASESEQLVSVSYVLAKLQLQFAFLMHRLPYLFGGNV